MFNKRTVASCANGAGLFNKYSVLRGTIKISQGFIIKEDKVLMVKQYVQRGTIVWNFPGGGIEEGESPEQACEREVKEETGYGYQ